MLLKICCIIFGALFVPFTDATLDPVCLEPATIDTASCCRIPELITNTEDIINKCGKHMSKNPSSDTKSEDAEFNLFTAEVRCFAECIFNETGALKDRVFQPAIAKKILSKKLINDKDWLPVLEIAIDSCQETATKNPNPTDAKEDECDHHSSLYFGCIDTQLFKNCPTNKWTSNEECDQLKKNAEKCPILMALFGN